ncbi:MAG: hypothetical protein CMH50_12790 [Myxococcales bacterium]|nr:hypothetical protein [Myxococcales bacterium]
MESFVGRSAVGQRLPCPDHADRSAVTTEFPIDLRGVSRSYRDDQPVLSDLDLQVATGEVVAVLGRSGTGKSTLLRIIAGLDRGYVGRALLGGRSVQDLSDDQLSAYRAQSVGIIFQSFHLLDHLSAAENVDLGARFAPKTGVESTADLLAAVGLEGRGHEQPALMSGGERQRLAIARALRNQPEIILADEPTGNLDEETGRLVINLLGELGRGRGVASVWVTHEERLADAADRVLILENGKLEQR